MYLQGTHQQNQSAATGQALVGQRADTPFDVVSTDQYSSLTTALIGQPIVLDEESSQHLGQVKDYDDTYIANSIAEVADVLAKFEASPYHQEKALAEFVAQPLYSESQRDCLNEYLTSCLEPLKSELGTFKQTLIEQAKAGGLPLVEGDYFELTTGDLEHSFGEEDGFSVRVGINEMLLHRTLCFENYSTSDQKALLAFVELLYRYGAFSFVCNNQYFFMGYTQEYIDDLPQEVKREFINEFEALDDSQLSEENPVCQALIEKVDDYISLEELYGETCLDSLVTFMEELRTSLEIMDVATLIDSLGQGHSITDKLSDMTTAQHIEYVKQIFNDCAPSALVSTLNTALALYEHHINDIEVGASLDAHLGSDTPIELGHSVALFNQGVEILMIEDQYNHAFNSEMGTPAVAIDISHADHLSMLKNFTLSMMLFYTFSQ